ncbi:MAG: hypothetical protein QCI82_10395 [Candidatus Thermoplasmatota archaeon]|nr:hypothetical protein [Candidatus Thermoplasmatota archaeon]
MRFSNATLIIVVIIVPASLQLSFPSIRNGCRIYDDCHHEREGISLGGTELMEDAASVRIIGESFLPVGEALATYSWICDVNGE